MSTRIGRRETDPELGQSRRAEDAVRETLPVPAAPAKSAAEPPAAPFEAQLLGQPGVKRGLRGGPEVLEHARSAYLEAEYSGPADRRPPRGVITRKDI
jgi:hypothetical protein